jgi:hypothetical protein
MELSNLAYFRIQTGEYAKAEVLLLRYLEIAKKTYGDQHSEVGATLSHLAEVYCKEKKFPAADPASAEAVAILRASLGADHPAVAGALQTRADVLRGLGRDEEADAADEEAQQVLALHAERNP